MTKHDYWRLGAVLLLVGLIGIGLYQRYQTNLSLERVVSVPNMLSSDKQPPLNLLATLPDLEYVDTPDSRAEGLSGRPSLSERAGLLFIFEKSALHGFWMKGMHFPIDMIWLDEAGVVVGLKGYATPESFPKIFYPEAPARYVLEINVGFIADHELRLGEKVLLPTR